MLRVQSGTVWYAAIQSKRHDFFDSVGFRQALPYAPFLYRLATLGPTPPIVSSRSLTSHSFAFAILNGVLFHIPLGFGSTQCRPSIYIVWLWHTRCRSVCSHCRSEMGGTEGRPSMLFVFRRRPRYQNERELFSPSSFLPPNHSRCILDP